MTDIVERLRALFDGKRWPMMDEAADEIERLRASDTAWKIIAKQKDGWNALPQSEKEETWRKALDAEVADSIKKDDEIERLREAAKPFAEWGWYDAELEDDNCPLVRHSGPVTVGHWRALRLALGMKP